MPIVEKRQKTTTDESVLSLPHCLLPSLHLSRPVASSFVSGTTANAAHARRIVINNGNLGAGKNRT